MCDVEESDVPAKKAKMDVPEINTTTDKEFDFTSDEVIEKAIELPPESHQELNVNNEELEQLRQFQVLDEVRDDTGSEDNAESETSDDEDLPDEEIEKMLEEDLPEELKAAPKLKPKPYQIREKLFLVEKGVSHFEVLPKDWIAVRHNSGIPVYLHRTGRVCTLSRPYFLGTGSARKHDIPLSAIPCLNYQKALEDEEKQKKVEETIEKSLKNGKVINVTKPTVLTDEFLKNLQNDANTDNENDDNVVDNKNLTEMIEKTKTPDKNSNLSNNCDSFTNDNVTNDIDSSKDANNCDSNTNDKVETNGVDSNAANVVSNDGKSNSPKCPFHVENDKTNDDNQNNDNNDNQTEKNDNCEEKKENSEGWNRPVLLPGGKILAPTRIETVHENWKKRHLTHEQVHEYCKKLFIFNKVSSKSFKVWNEKRKYAKVRKRLRRPLPPEGTKLITITQPATGDNRRPVQKEWIMNTQGRSNMCIFHDYVMMALNKQPVYHFQQLENAATPYQATVTIGDMQYGVGYGTSKRQAKAEAAKASMKILLPELNDTNDTQETDFAFFDFVGIEDPRITDFCSNMMEPSPHAILKTCLLRNFGADKQIVCETKMLRRQRMEFTMKVGKHTASVVCKNKKIGKQRASQAILQALHPHIKSWGSLLRLYGSRSVKSCKEKKQEEQQITLLQDKATVNQPNYAILEKLRSEMRRLKQRDEAVAPISTMVLDIPQVSSSDLNNVEL